MACIYIGILLFLNTDYASHKIADYASNILRKELGTSVNIQSARIGLFNKINLVNINLIDQQGKKALDVKNISAYLDIFKLVDNKLVIKHLCISDANCIIYRKNEKENTNIQFLIDSLSSPSSNKQNELILDANSIVLHNINVQYDILNSPTSPQKFNLSHLHLRNLCGNFLINYQGNGKSNIRIRNLKVNEKSGLTINNCQAYLQIRPENILLKNFTLNLNNSSFKVAEAMFATQQSKQIEKLEGNALLAISDLKYFLPEASAFKTNKLNINISVNGNSREFFSHITANDIDKELAMDIECNLPQQALNKGPFKCNGKINSCRISSEFIQKISQISEKTAFVKTLIPIGNVQHQGSFTYAPQDILLKGTTKTEIGEFAEVIHIENNRIKGQLQAKDFHYEKLISEGHTYKHPTNANIEFTGLTKPVNINVISKIQQLSTEKYCYQNISFNGKVTDTSLQGDAKIDDNNLKLTATPKINFNNKNLIADINANIYKFQPKALGLINDIGDIDITSKISANYSSVGAAKDIHVDMDNLNVQKDNKNYNCKNFNLKITENGTDNKLTLRSDYIDASINSEDKLTHIPDIICSFIASAFPSLKKFAHYNSTPIKNTRFSSHIKDTKLISELASIPLDIKEPCTISGYVNAREKTIRLISRLPKFTYNNEPYANASIYLTGNLDTLNIISKLRKEFNQGYVNISLGIPIKNNTLHPQLKWQGNKEGNSGELNSICNFNTLSEDNIANIHIDPSQISIQDTVWKINSTDINLFKESISMTPMEIRHDNQYMSIQNANSASSPFLVSFNGFEVSPILDLVNFHSVKFAGKLYGNATIPSKIDNSSTIPAKIQVRDFLFQDGVLGTLDVIAHWDGTEKRININAKTHETENDSLLIKGYVDIDNDELELNFAPQFTNMDFVNSWLRNVLGKTVGTVSGKLQLKGPLDSLDFNGRVAIDNMNFTPPLTNAPYVVTHDSVFFTEGKFIFQDFTIRDSKHGSCVVQGAVTHNKLKNFGYDLHFDANNFYAYNWDGIDRDIFWGKIYTDGYGRLHGTTTDVYAELNLTPKNGSTFYYNNSETKDTEASEFIHFHNGKENSLETSEGLVETNNELLKDDETDVHFNLVANTNPSTQLVIYTDKKTGDGLYLRGEGPLTTTWHNKGKFTINGQYVTTGGEYHLTIQDLMKRNFQIQPKGSLSFNGNAEEGDLNLKGVYTVHSVSLSDLNIGQNISNATTNVNCLLNFGGKANNPQVTFGLEFPTAGDDISKTIKSAISSQEDINMQMLYLLTIGRFYTYDFETSSSASTQNQSMLAMQSLFANTLGSSLGSIISQALHLNNWTFGPSISTGRLGFDDMEVGGQFQGSLLQNRLQLSGNFGYREQNTYSNNFVGDFNLRWLLNPKGTISLKAYSETNDRYFSKSSLSTQGGGILFMHDFNKFNTIFGKSKKRKQTNKKQ